jgi:DNA-binding NarL/FixJ family response regulator
MNGEIAEIGSVSKKNIHEIHQNIMDKLNVILHNNDELVDKLTIIAIKTKSRRYSEKQESRA